MNERKPTMNILIVVDMQNDFTHGALRNEAGIQIIPHVVKKIQKARENGDLVIFTLDTHGKDYMTTEEGKNLPVEHCIKGSAGHELVDELKPFLSETDTAVFEKNTFGSKELGSYLSEIRLVKDIEKIELVGLCTDICVISNAVIAKSFMPDIPIYVDAACCAGVTAESHDTALQAMKAIQVHVENEGTEPWRNT